MRECISRAATILGFICVLGAVDSAYAASLVVQLKLDANTGVLNTSAAPAANGDLVGTWTDQSGMGNDATLPALPAGSTNPQYSTNYLATGEKAVAFTAVADTDRLETPTPVISGTTDFLISARFYVAANPGAHDIATTYGVGNLQGFEMVEYQDKLQFYVGPVATYVGTGLSISARNNTFLDVAVSRSGNLYTLYADMNSDGDFLDAGESLSATVGTAATSFSSSQPLMIGNINYGDLPIAINSLEISFSVPEPASVAMLMLGLPFVRRGRRR